MHLAQVDGAKQSAVRGRERGERSAVPLGGRNLGSDVYERLDDRRREHSATRNVHDLVCAAPCEETHGATRPDDQLGPRPVSDDGVGRMDGARLDTAERRIAVDGGCDPRTLSLQLFFVREVDERTSAAKGGMFAEHRPFAGLAQSSARRRLGRRLGRSDHGRYALACARSRGVRRRSDHRGRGAVRLDDRARDGAPCAGLGEALSLACSRGRRIRATSRAPARLGHAAISFFGTSAWKSACRV